MPISQAYVVPLGADGLAAAERQPVPNGNGGVRSLLWSPDASVLFWSNGPQLMEWHRGSAAARTTYVATDALKSFTAAWSNSTVPDIVFATLGEATELHELTLRDGGRAAAGASLPLIRRAGNTISPALSPDGRWLAFEATGKDGELELWLAGAQGENPHSIAALAVGVPLVWSSNSQRLTFHARAQGAAQLFVVDIDAEGNVTSTRQLTQSTFSLFGPAFSADGRYLYAISNRNPNAQRIVRLPVAGGDLEDLFEGGGGVRLSVDGRRIFYGRPPTRGIYERSLEGDVPSNPETLVLEDYVGPLGFVPGPAGIVYVGRDEQRRPVALRFFDFAMRRSFDLGPPPDSDVPTLSLSADGSRLVFEHASSVVADLTHMELRRGR
jgi:Tol biopolymer transport system component